MRLRFSPRRYFIENFARKAALSLGESSKVLDAGAGPCPYKKYFSHCNYEAMDFKKLNDNINFVSSLDKIPRKSESYDAVLSTEVLEHVEYPQKVVNEMHRILKKNGKLFMTCPLAWKVHQEPYNYFYFTKFGLKSLLKNAGFKKYKISPMGGYFFFLADTLKTDYVLNQYSGNIFYWPIRVITYPFNQIIIPFLSFYFDKLDKTKEYTMGYLVEAIK